MDAIERDIFIAAAPERVYEIVVPRQIAMYLAKQMTEASLPEIGRQFGNKHHTTVMHSVRKIEELRTSDRAMAEDIELLKRMIEN